MPVSHNISKNQDCRIRKHTGGVQKCSAITVMTASQIYSEFTHKKKCSV